jgi:hypothetical protein
MGAARRPLPTVLVDGVLYAVTPLTPRRKTGDGRFLLQSEWGEYYAVFSRTGGFLSGVSMRRPPGTMNRLQGIRFNEVAGALMVV